MNQHNQNNSSHDHFHSSHDRQTMNGSQIKVQNASDASRASIVLSQLNFPIHVNFGYNTEDFIISDSNGNKVGDYQVMNSNTTFISGQGGALAYKSLVEPIASKYESKFIDANDKTIGYFTHRGILTSNTRVKLFKNDVHCYTIKDTNLFMWILRIFIGFFIDEDEDEVPYAWLKPSYKVLDRDGGEVLKITRSKNPIHDKFTVEKTGRINSRDDGLILCGLLEMIYTEIMLVED